MTKDEMKHDEGNTYTPEPWKNYHPGTDRT